MAFCTACGSGIPENIKFCPMCGVSITPPEPVQPEPPSPPPVYEAPEPVQPEPPSPIQSESPVPPPAAVFSTQQMTQTAASQSAQQTVQPPPYQPPLVPGSPGNADVWPPKGSQYAMVNTISYIGLMILYAIPVLGWIFCIVMAFAAHNKNIRHYARAMFILWIVIIVLTAAAYIVLLWFFSASLSNIMDYISNVIWWY